MIACSFLALLGRLRSTRIVVIRRIGRVWPLHVVLLAVFVLFEAARAILGFVRWSRLGAMPLVGGLVIVVVLSPAAMDRTFEYGDPRCLAGVFSDVIVCMFWRDRLKDCRIDGLTGTALAGHFVFSVLILVFALQPGVLSALLSGKVGRMLGDLP